MSVGEIEDPRIEKISRTSCALQISGRASSSSTKMVALGSDFPIDGGKKAIVGFTLIGSIFCHPERDQHSKITNIPKMGSVNPTVGSVAVEEFSHVVCESRLLDNREPIIL